ncbi:fumarylacetoacetase [Aquincola sp. S2]|uniref:fumarylacetoacetase n=1 Tax=Pseudaquabacterium terrae TaxID=2732868 RepID=A0ABX2E9I6_9BURK|nr:fumarylacetoacetase [Aquabacterium terrae]NRF65674.1 fumarylacetoacetase [Aquabacterium terrae]
MSAELDTTHDPALRSWVESANAADADFPIQNLPYGRFRRNHTDEPWRIGIAIGDQVLDLKLAAEQCPWPTDVAALLQPLAAGDLNAFMDLGPDARRTLRTALSQALTEGSEQGPFLELCLVPQTEVELSVPCRIGDYTDFYTGIHHATTVGKLFRPDNPLLPNYKWVPIGYHGRGSSIVTSGQGFRRPRGQFKGPDDPHPSFGPCKRLDYELELGAFIGGSNAMGEPIDIEDAEDRLFGVVLLNDWSARDVQAWEYQPLGPFLSKSFATTISPWIVTPEALAPFRVAFERSADDPQPLPYLDSAANRASGGLDIILEVWLQTAAMREADQPHQRLMASNFRDSYWTLAQLITHHASNGCNLASGDLLGSGTQSGPQPGQGGSLLELSAGGKQPLALASGEQRTFLQDGDSVLLRAYCERGGARRIGFGECEGTVLPAVAPRG